MCSDAHSSQNPKTKPQRDLDSTARQPRTAASRAATGSHRSAAGTGQGGKKDAGSPLKRTSSGTYSNGWKRPAFLRAQSLGPGAVWGDISTSSRRGIRRPQGARGPSTVYADIDSSDSSNYDVADSDDDTSLDDESESPPKGLTNAPFAYSPTAASRTVTLQRSSTRVPSPATAVNSRPVACLGEEDGEAVMSGSSSRISPRSVQVGLSRDHPSPESEYFPASGWGDNDVAAGDVRRRISSLSDYSTAGSTPPPVPKGRRTRNHSNSTTSEYDGYDDGAEFFTAKDEESNGQDYPDLPSPSVSLRRRAEELDPRVGRPLSQSHAWAPMPPLSASNLVHEGKKETPQGNGEGRVAGAANATENLSGLVEPEFVPSYDDEPPPLVCSVGPAATYNGPATPSSLQTSGTAHHCNTPGQPTRNGSATASKEIPQLVRSLQSIWPGGDDIGASFRDGGGGIASPKRLEVGHGISLPHNSFPESSSGQIVSIFVDEAKKETAGLVMRSAWTDFGPDVSCDAIDHEDEDSNHTAPATSSNCTMSPRDMTPVGGTPREMTPSSVVRTAAHSHPLHQEGNAVAAADSVVVVTPDCYYNSGTFSMPMVPLQSRPSVRLDIGEYLSEGEIVTGGVAPDMMSPPRLKRFRRAADGNMVLTNAAAVPVRRRRRSRRRSSSAADEDAEMNAAAAAVTSFAASSLTTRDTDSDDSDYCGSDSDYSDDGYDRQRSFSEARSKEAYPAAVDVHAQARPRDDNGDGCYWTTGGDRKWAGTVEAVERGRKSPSRSLDATQLSAALRAVHLEEAAAESGGLGKTTGRWGSRKKSHGRVPSGSSGGGSGSRSRRSGEVLRRLKRALSFEPKQAPPERLSR